MAAMQQMWASGMRMVPRILPEYSFTDPTGGWTAELAVGLW